MCDVGILKLIDQDVAVFFLQRPAQLRVPLQQSNRSGDQRAKRNAVLFTQQFFAGPVGARKLLLQRDRLQAFHECVFVQRFPLGFHARRQPGGIALIVFGGH